MENNGNNGNNEERVEVTEVKPNKFVQAKTAIGTWVGHHPFLTIGLSAIGGGVILVGGLLVYSLAVAGDDETTETIDNETIVKDD